MRAVLIDDEPIALEVLSRMLSGYKEVSVVGSYTYPAEALSEIIKMKPDVVFLDIEMPKIDGLAFADTLLEELENVEIVFVTAFSQYAIEAFELNAIDYLLKPVQEKRLRMTMERLEEKFVKVKGLGQGLKINSFGSFRVVDFKGEPLMWRTQKTKELFAYLWINKDHGVSKNLLLEYIFPDKEIDNATTLLHTTIYQLRKNLEKAGYPGGIIFKDDCYVLNLPVSSDLQKLKQILESKTYQEADLRAVMEIYQGDFIEESYFWVIRLQQRYKELVVGYLERFAKKLLSDSSFTSLLKDCLEKIYAVDPFSDEMAKLFIQFYGLQKKRASLDSFFREYKKNLQIELNLPPSKETVILYKKYIV
ncbi:MAG: response regulator [Bacillota bacterium]